LLWVGEHSEPYPKLGEGFISAELNPALAPLTAALPQIACGWPLKMFLCRRQVTVGFGVYRADIRTGCRVRVVMARKCGRAAKTL